MQQKTDTSKLTPQDFIVVICKHQQVAAKVFFVRNERTRHSIHAMGVASPQFPWQQHLFVHLHQVVTDTSQHICQITHMNTHTRTHTHK